MCVASAITTINFSLLHIFKVGTSWLIWFVPVHKENHPSVIDLIIRERSGLTGKEAKCLHQRLPLSLCQISQFVSSWNEQVKESDVYVGLKNVGLTGHFYQNIAKSIVFVYYSWNDVICCKSNKYQYYLIKLICNLIDLLLDYCSC